MLKLKKIIASAMSLAIACTAVPMTASMTSSAATITYLQGDADGDNSIGLSDLTLLTRYLNGGLNADANQLTRMDAIQNKVINMQDYNKTLNCYFGLDTAQTVTSQTYTNLLNESMAYEAYNCDSNELAGRYTIMTPTSTANVNSRIFENYDDYVDDENLNTVEVGAGSGFIIGDNLVATAAHCVYNQNGYVQDLKVTVYNQDGTEPLMEYDAQFIHIPTLFKTYTDNMAQYPDYANTRLNYDYALVYVKNDVNGNNISRHGVWSLGYPTYEFDSTGSDVISSGFTGTDGTSKPSRRYYSCGPVKPYDNINRIYSDAMVYGGKSGGPLYYEDTYDETTVKTVVGINSSYIDPVTYYVRATRITPTISRFFLNNPKIEEYVLNASN